jgi:hypothetical protein
MLIIIVIALCKMNVFDEKFKEFAFLSISENDEYKKIYILSLHDTKDYLNENIPYVYTISPLKKITINNIQYQIPKVIKHLCFLDKKNNKLIAEDKTLQYIDDYIKNLSKIERLLLLLRSDLNNMDFYMLRDANIIIDKLNLIIFDFEISIKFFTTTENVNKIEDIQRLMENVQSMITSKVVYQDILNSRILSVVSLTALPILVIMNTWSAIFAANDSILNKNNYRFAYRMTQLLAIILIFSILYIYRKDFNF